MICFLQILLFLFSSCIYANEKNEADFNSIIRQTFSFYSAEFNKPLKLNIDWKSDAYSFSPREYISHLSLSIPGGAYRDKIISKDVFSLMLCHEIGHFLAGSPNYASRAVNIGEENLAIEGQSDYWAASHCFKKLFKNENNISFVKKYTFGNDAFYIKDILQLSDILCSRHWSTANDQALCQRTMLAGAGYAKIARIMGRERYWVNIKTPDQNIAAETYAYHPKAQCRLDTFVAGALCASKSTNYICNRQDHAVETTRPLCWYKPNEK